MTGYFVNCSSSSHQPNWAFLELVLRAQIVLRAAGGFFFICGYRLRALDLVASIADVGGFELPPCCVWPESESLQVCSLFEDIPSMEAEIDC